MSVRVRFAPSPTGHVHIGNIRAAIFNWLYARHEGGAFLLRVEDTDLVRSTTEAIRTLLDVMAWLGLDFDEPVVYQTQMIARHREAAGRLLADGQAYRLARNPDEPPAVMFRIPVGDVPGMIRSAGPAEILCHAGAPVVVDFSGVKYAIPSKKGEPVACEGCLAGFRDLRLFKADGSCVFELAPRLDAVLQGGAALTFEGVSRMAFTRREVFFSDLVKGELAKPLDGMKDLVIVRSDGSPVFHLANVCDDVTQAITHIIRGDDHVENTYRHVMLFNALGAVPPRYAHLPMIINAQGKPYSKRDGDAYVGDFRDKGFLPGALFNYLTLLGWSPGDDLEKMTRDEAVRLFTLDRIKSAPAQMDMRKLTALNAEYVAALPPDVFVAQARDYIRRYDWAGRVTDEAYFRRVCALMQSRAHVYGYLADWRHYFEEIPSACDEKAVQKILHKEGVRGMLQTLQAELEACDFSLPALEQAMRRTEQAAGLGEGKLNQPVRVALTGSSIGAGIYETMDVLGRPRVLARLAHAVAAWCM
jgi:glutamyl/glutaminyl-tRNA synthetase